MDLLATAVILWLQVSLLMSDIAEAVQWLYFWDASRGVKMLRTVRIPHR